MSKIITCVRCNGTGVIKVGDGTVSGKKNEITCPICHETGKVRV